MSYLKYVNVVNEELLGPKNTKDDSIYATGIIEYIIKNFSKLPEKLGFIYKNKLVFIPSKNLALTRLGKSTFVSFVENDEVFKIMEEFLYCWDEDGKYYREWYPFLEIKELQ